MSVLPFSPRATPSIFAAVGVSGLLHAGLLAGVLIWLAPRLVQQQVMSRPADPPAPVSVSLTELTVEDVTVTPIAPQDEQAAALPDRILADDPTVMQPAERQALDIDPATLPQPDTPALQTPLPDTPTLDMPDLRGDTPTDSPAASAPTDATPLNTLATPTTRDPQSNTSSSAPDTGPDAAPPISDAVLPISQVAPPISQAASNPIASQPALDRVNSPLDERVRIIEGPQGADLSAAPSTIDAALPRDGTLEAAPVSPPSLEGSATTSPTTTAALMPTPIAPPAPEEDTPQPPVELSDQTEPVGQGNQIVDPNAAQRAIAAMIVAIRDQPATDCAIALPRLTPDGGTALALVGQQAQALDRYATDIIAAIAPAPQLRPALVGPAQCDILNALRDLVQYPVSRLGFALTASELTSGDTPLSVTISGAADLVLRAFVIDDSGVAQSLGPFMRNGEGERILIDAPVARAGGPVQVRQILLILGHPRMAPVPPYDGPVTIERLAQDMRAREQADPGTRFALTTFSVTNPRP